MLGRCFSKLFIYILLMGKNLRNGFRNAKLVSDDPE